MKVIFGIGLPASGKSTALVPLAEQLGYTYLSRDDIREELTGDPTNHTREPEVSALFDERLIEALQFGGLIIDTTMTKKADRISTVELCRTAGASEITALWFNTPLKECLKRNAARARVVPENVLRTMHAKLQADPPTEAEGYDVLALVHA